MHTSLQNVLRHATATEGHAHVARRQAGNAINFQKVLESSAAATPTLATVNTPAATVSNANTNATAAADDSIKRLGPFTGDPNARPQAIPDPAPMPTATYTPLPASQQALLNQPWDPFNKAQHEATMNNWYIKEAQNENQQKLQIYQQGVADWKVNAAHCRDLGIQAPPPPTVPVLTAVGPMPDGYWFGKNA